MGSAIDIYAEQETLDFLHRVYRHIFEAEKNINRSFVARLLENELRVGEALDLFGLRFTPLRLLHGRQPVLGFRVEALDDSGEVAEPQLEPELPIEKVFPTTVRTKFPWSMHASMNYQF